MKEIIKIKVFQDSDGEWWAIPQNRTETGTYKYPKVGKGRGKWEAISKIK